MLPLRFFTFDEAELGKWRAIPHGQKERALSKGAFAAWRVSEWEPEAWPLSPALPPACGNLTVISEGLSSNLTTL